MTTTASKPLITCIGSLPHPNIDSALGFSFRCDIPFLPQIPLRNPWEFMIAQACEGLPGLEARSDGSAVIDLAVWSGRTRALTQRLDDAFARADSDPRAFEAFEPSNATSSSWQPFLFELEERKTPRAKIQIAGPITSQWAITTHEGREASSDPDLGAQIVRLVLARAIAMVRRLKSIGVTPLIFLDEPGLYALSSLGPRKIAAYGELSAFIRTLQREGAQVGVHCCSDIEWSELLALKPDYLSLDAQLSLDSLLRQELPLQAFLKNGGHLSLGIVPTNYREGQATAEERLASARTALSRLPRSATGMILTPACGLAFHTVEAAEEVLSSLHAIQERISAGVATS